MGLQVVEKDRIREEESEEASGSRSESGCQVCWGGGGDTGFTS